MLQAGTACRTINPESGVRLWGFPNVDERANAGVGIDLQAKALYLATGGNELVIITADLLGLNREYVRLIREKVTAQTGLAAESIMIASSHTHSAPLLEPHKGFEPDQAYIDGMLDTMAAVVADARNAAVPAKAGYGVGEADLCHNRRVLRCNGKVSSGWEDHAHEHEGITDKRVFVLKITDDKNKPLAVLVNYACHPVVMGPPNALASSDYPGYMKAYIEKELPGAAAFFTNAGGGNINPYACIGDDPAVAEKMGADLGAEALRVADTIEMEDIDSLASVSVQFKLDMRPGMDAVQQKRLNVVDGKVPVEIQTVRLGDILLVTTPGELLVEIALQLKEESGCAKTMVVAYANDYAGYLPPDAVLEQDGYEVTSAVSHNVEGPFIAAMKEGIARLQ